MSDDNHNGEDDDDLQVDAASEPLPSQEEILEGLPEIEDVSLDEQMSAQAQKPGRFKKEDVEKFIKYAVIGGFVLIIVMMVYSCQPKKGSMGYGICSTFLELNTTYPHTLEFSDVEFSQTAVRIYFSNVDAFGEFKHEMIECTFAPDEKMGMRLSEVKRNRNPMDAQTIKEFNETLPTIVESDPYRLLPPEWENQWRLE